MSSCDLAPRAMHDRQSKAADLTLQLLAKDPPRS